MDEKAELRRWCRETREGMAPEVADTCSLTVCDHLRDWPLFQLAKAILAYLAFGNEIDLGELIECLPGKRWLVPRVVEGGELKAGEPPYLSIHPYDPTKLVRHRFGMLEPDPALPTVDPSEIDVILVPGVAFDQQGGRLGFGGGFYDRLLPLATRAIRVGVTYDDLVFDCIPMQPWDCRVDWLITPNGLIKTERI